MISDRSFVDSELHPDGDLSQLFDSLGSSAQLTIYRILKLSYTAEINAALAR